jgi:hypothetical protein
VLINGWLKRVRLLLNAKAATAKGPAPGSSAILWRGPHCWAWGICCVLAPRSSRKSPFFDPGVGLTAAGGVSPEGVPWVWGQPELGDAGTSAAEVASALAAAVAAHGAARREELSRAGGSASGQGSDRAAATGGGGGEAGV